METIEFCLIDRGLSVSQFPQFTGQGVKPETQNPPVIFLSARENNQTRFVPLFY